MVPSVMSVCLAAVMYAANECESIKVPMNQEASAKMLAIMLTPLRSLSMCIHTYTIIQLEVLLTQNALCQQHKQRGDTVLEVLLKCCLNCFMPTAGKRQWAFPGMGQHCF